MEPEQVDHLELYELLRDWVRPRLSWFPRWTFDDILHEAFIVALDKLDGFDSSRGSRWSYLSPRLFDPIWRKYMSHEGYRIDRHRVAGRWMRRKAVKVVTLMDKVPEPLETQTQNTSMTSTNWTNQERTDTAHLLMRGLRPIHIAASRGVTQAAVSSIVSRMRQEWIDRQENRP